MAATSATQPPVEAYLRVIDEPVLRLTSVDLGASADISSLSEVFDFARDYLGLLKAAVIAAGIVPPGIEGSGQNLADLLARLVGPGRGLELVSHVNDIPKGSRLAVSTNLLAVADLRLHARHRPGAIPHRRLAEDERRLVLARALLGEWLGGSGGGWQDSGGVWPGMKLICGVIAHGRRSGIRHQPRPPHADAPDSRSTTTFPPETRERLQQSLVLVHGGMAQNVGPILEMVTEKYLLRSAAEWTGRQQAIGVLDEIVGRAPRRRRAPARRADDAEIFASRSRPSFPGQAMRFTESLIATVQRGIRRRISGASGCWAACPAAAWDSSLNPERKAEAQKRLQEIMSQTKQRTAARPALRHGTGGL